MPDITMCANDKCDKRLTCYRFMAKPSKLSQAYFSPKTGLTIVCEYYLEYKNGK